jgi:hypothetical protein
MHRQECKRLVRFAACTVVLIALVMDLQPLNAQVPVRAKLPPVQTRQFDNLAAGPYNRLLIRDAMVIPGHGGPPIGPYDILIQGNLIADMRMVTAAALKENTAARWTADRVIEGRGMYVMPGMIDLHYHTREAELPLEYTHYLKLAHGVTSGVPGADARTDEVQRQHDRAERYEYLAPRMFPIWRWGRGTGTTLAEQEDPAQAPRIARAMKAAGAHVVDVGRGDVFWTPELLTAVCKAVKAEGGITTFHLPPSTTNVVNAVDAARAGVTMIEHLYGYAEAALPRQTQDFPTDYDYDNENHRFRQAARVWMQVGQDPRARERLLGPVVDSLIAYGATMLPTRVTYEGNRDLLRGFSLPWHEKYTHQALVDRNGPDVTLHAAHHWDWTSDDEYNWHYAFNLWSELIHEFNRRGGRVAYGSDDNFQWATAGFSNIRELQLMRESGMHNLEVIQAATYNSALTLGQPKLGLIHQGYFADLLVVDGNPAENFHYLYSFGAIRLGENGRMYRTRGIVHTIKDGVVIENSRLMARVEQMVAESKKNVKPSIVTDPFRVRR